MRFIRLSGSILFTLPQSRSPQFLTGNFGFGSPHELLRLEITVLEEKLAHQEQQDLYFRLGFESNKKRLISLKQQFEVLRQEVNTADVEALLQEERSIEDFLKWYQATAQTGFIKEIVIHSKTSRIRHIQLIVGLRNDVRVIKSLTHYQKIMI